MGSARRGCSEGAVEGASVPHVELVSGVGAPHGASVTGGRPAGGSDVGVDGADGPCGNAGIAVDGSGSGARSPRNNAGSGSSGGGVSLDEPPQLAAINAHPIAIKRQ